MISVDARIKEFDKSHEPYESPFFRCSLPSLILETDFATFYGDKAEQFRLSGSPLGDLWDNFPTPLSVNGISIFDSSYLSTFHG